MLGVEPTIAVLARQPAAQTSEPADRMTSVMMAASALMATINSVAGRLHAPGHPKLAIGAAGSIGRVASVSGATTLVSLGRASRFCQIYRNRLGEKELSTCSRKTIAPTVP